MDDLHVLSKVVEDDDIRVDGTLSIGGADVHGTGPAFRVRDPVRGEALPPVFRAAARTEVARACLAAERAVSSFARSTGEVRAALLDAIADALTEIEPLLRERLGAETGLARGEVERVLAARRARLRAVAALLRELAHPVDPGRDGAPREGRAPLGPAAFVVDPHHRGLALVPSDAAIAALAVGCPIVVRAHAAHAGTCELSARAIRRALVRTGADRGAFSLLLGASADAALLAHPAIRVVSWVGADAFGRAVRRARRPRSAPLVYVAEDPARRATFVLPGALNADAERIATREVARLRCAVERGAGPRVLVALERDGYRELRDALVTAVEALAPSPVPGAARRVREGRVRAGELDPIALGHPSAAQRERATLYEVDARRAEGVISRVEGVALVLVRCGDEVQLGEVAARVSARSSVATIRATRDDAPLACVLVGVLERRARTIVVRAPDPRLAEEVDPDIAHAPSSCDLARFERAIFYDGVPVASTVDALARILSR